MSSSDFKSSTKTTITYQEVPDMYKNKKDPWEHRSSGMRCKSCMFWVKKETEIQVKESSGLLGRCRRHAPTISGFPAVFEMDWCGDHKLDENKV